MTSNEMHGSRDYEGDCSAVEAKLYDRDYVPPFPVVGLNEGANKTIEKRSGWGPDEVASLKPTVYFQVDHDEAMCLAAFTCTCGHRAWVKLTSSQFRPERHDEWATLIGMELAHFARSHARKGHAMPSDLPN